jgi:hypothetical protein
MKNLFTIIPTFLKDPSEFFLGIQRNEELKTKALSLFVSSITFFMIYGFVTGLSHSWLQALSTAVKMPLLFLLTLVFTLPALYFFALALLNIRFSIAQAGVVVLSGIGVTSFLLLGFSPVTLFFVLTSSNYPFFQLIAVLFSSISGFTGLSYVLRGFNWVDKEHELNNSPFGKMLLRAWVVLYGFVGAQMTWRLSPLIGDPTQPFYLFRPSRDNFFVDTLNAFYRAIGVNTHNSIVDITGIAFCGGIVLVIAFVVGAWIRSKRKSSNTIAPSQPTQKQMNDQGEQPKTA